ncbi:MAG: iron uptake porin [Leptolyngbyaceae cyanobacterium bins.59]|nr:iron uptake porin [Leptolyngbyaceae cyanobacterium bins.59]
MLKLILSMRLGLLGLLCLVLMPTVASADSPPRSTLADNSNGFGQVTSVSQLSDVQPTDWAFQALQSLVERYGCIAGYPDSTYRGSRPLTRYEFAAGLNACMDRVNELIASATADLVTKSDLETLRRLQEEFATELATLRGRVDALEARTAKLEATQFSTTTKLVGEAIFSVSDTFGGNAISFPFSGGTTNADTVGTVFQNRVRLNFLSSFNGQDLLRIRLQSGNAIPLLTSGAVLPSGAYALFSNEGRFTYDDSSAANSNNSVYLSRIDYSFLLSRQIRVNVFANGGFSYSYADTVSPYLDSEGGGTGALSRFGERNPIYNINGGGAGVGINYQLSNAFKIDFGYLANRANDPNLGAGLFNGNYTALAQLVFQPMNQLKVGLTYVNAYNTAGNFRYGSAGTAVGSFQSNLLPGAIAGVPFATVPVSSNSYGVQVSFQLSPNFVIGGWGGFTAARLIGYGDADIWNYAVTLAFPNLGGKGNLGGIIVGAEPTLKGIQSRGGQVSIPNRDDTWHIEGFYRYQLTDNISVTPGVIWLPSANQNSANPDIVIGTLRTTFTF